MPFRSALRAAAAGGLVAVLAIPVAAHATVLTHSDPAQDVQKVTASETTTTITDAPDNETADIVHLGVRYGVKRLKETVRLRGLSDRWFLSSRIQAPSRHFDLVVTHRPGTTQATLTKGKGRILVVCDGLVPDVDRPHHTVSVTVPADCLVAPPWVKVGTGIVVRGVARTVSFADDALRRRGIAEAHLTLTQKIHQT
jgi:hypothetical protein